MRPEVAGKRHLKILPDRRDQTPIQRHSAPEPGYGETSVRPFRACSDPPRLLARRTLES